MDADDTDRSIYEWQPRLIIVPRIGLRCTRDGPRTRVILPGRYLVRRSRTLRARLYRRLTTDFGATENRA